jgi:3-oxoacyl-[acyl-carrier-protein] synthase-3
VDNAAVAEHLGVNEDWIIQRLGIKRRHILAEGERLTDLAILAGQQALEDGGVAPEDVDLVVVASTTQDELMPNMAPLVAAGIGASGVGAFDVGAACTGFLTSLSLGAGQIEAGRANTVVVVGTDALSRHVDPDDRRTAALFGDGAGAVVLRANAEARVGPTMLWSDASLAELVFMPRDTQVMYMEGLETYRHAVSALPSATNELLEAAGLEVSDVDLFVYHQANSRILRAVADRLGLEEHQRVDSLAETGNTSAASIPLALASVTADGRLRTGSRVLLGAIGGGFVWGACLVEWGASGENADNSA